VLQQPTALKRRTGYITPDPPHIYLFIYLFIYYETRTKVHEKEKNNTQNT